MARLIIVIDMCLTVDWKDVLVAEGYEPVLWRDVGDPKAKDNEIALWAAANNAVVLTQDLDYGEILALQGLTRPSVIQIRSDSPTPEDVGSVVLKAIRAFAHELASGAIVTVHPARSRVRLLPLK